MSALTPTWYDLLGVEPTSDADEIRAAWRTAIADLDPTERRFATLNEAAAVLLDPARRSAYDDELRAAEPEPAEEPVEAPIEQAEEPEAEEAAESPTESPTESPVADKPPYLVPGWVLASVAVVALAAVVLAAVLATRPSADKVIQADVQLSSGSQVTDIEEPAVAAVAAAKQAVVPVLSYDYRHLDADKAAADRALTDAYRSGPKGYDALFDTVIKGPATTTQTVVTVKVVGSAVVRAEPDRVQVLLFIDQSRTNKTSSTPAVFQNQVVLTMQKVGDQWLVDKMVSNQIAE